MGQEAKKKITDLVVQKKQSDLSNVESKDVLGESKNNLNSSDMQHLLEKDIIDEKQVVQYWAKKFNIEIIENLNNYKISQKVLDLVPRRICERHVLIPLTKIDQSLVVVFSDPSNLHIRDNISLLTGCKVQVVVASKSDIQRMLDNCYDNQTKLDSLFYDMDIENFGFENETVVDLDENPNQGPIVSLVNIMFSDAVNLKASDVHIELYENAFRIRYRIDGILYEKHTLSRDMAQSVIARVKVMCNMDISEKRRPQDARLKVCIKQKELNMRVSSVPTVNGEKIVLRILDNSSLQVDMGLLGMEKDQFKMFTEALKKPQGLILITGPTGSGKTTTIYSGLMTLNKTDTNISTVEDPVEFRINGINQVQTNNKVGLTFSTALRSFLRQDPDVILVGEIRDLETAEIAFKASSTGHLVLSTLHTNDTASTVIRLLSMGVPTYSVSDSMSLVISQRLLRCLCPECKELVKNSHLIDLKTLGIPKDEISSFALDKIFDKGDGCSHCNNLGYVGRVAVYEMMEVTPDIKKGILNQISSPDLKQIAVKNGMSTLRYSALNKLKEGVINIEEVIRTTMFD